MLTFLHPDFMLDTDTAAILFHEYAAHMPIIDYHCHIDPKEIAQNHRFANLTQAWLDGDHYKWRLMRAAGEEERFITGDACEYERFTAFARVLPQAAGNPVYVWTHMELKKYLDCDLPLNPSTADEIWRLGIKKLAEPGMSVRGIIRQSDVRLIATTDDPADDLQWHSLLARDDTLAARVIPTFRPDKALGIDQPGFAAYVHTLDAAIQTWDAWLHTLSARMDYFEGLGCRASDHAPEHVPFDNVGEKEAAGLFVKALHGQTLTPAEADQYKTALFLFLGAEYAKRDWVMQLHVGAKRNVNTRLYKALGADVGNDMINGAGCGHPIARLLDRLDQARRLPKTILYSLNPNDDIILQTLAGCFSQVRHGSAWWFNDTQPGIQKQLTSLASCGLLGGFVGMLTDSRSFLSYVRHEYFRRIVCNMLGGWVHSGEYPRDLPALGKLVQSISCHNAIRFFGFGDTWAE